MLFRLESLHKENLSDGQNTCTKYSNVVHLHVMEVLGGRGDTGPTLS
jgi:hypothetical protein